MRQEFGVARGTARKAVELLRERGLVTTVMGLAVAVPSVMAYNLLVSRLGVFAGELEGFAQEIIGTMADDRIGVYARPSVAGSALNGR